MISDSKTEYFLLDPWQRQAGKWWQSSIRCQLCSKLQPTDTMLQCSHCSYGWHNTCLQLQLDAVLEGNWLCAACKAAAAISDGSTHTSSSTPIHNL